jgi:hypothetical protein
MTCIFCGGAKCVGECQTPLAWTRDLAIDLCVKLEAIAPTYGAHVALSGGVLYREGPRKDCDLVIYRHGGRAEEIDRFGLVAALIDQLKMEAVRVSGRVFKMRYQGRQVDLMIHDAAEAADSDYDDEPAPGTEEFVAL